MNDERYILFHMGDDVTCICTQEKCPSTKTLVYLFSLGSSLIAIHMGHTPLLDERNMATPSVSVVK